MAEARPIIRPASDRDLKSFYPEAQLPTAKAWVAELDGEQIGFGGYAYHVGRWYVFFDIRDTARRFKIGIVKAARMVLSDADRNGIRFLYAVPNEFEPSAIRWLTSMGFAPDQRVRDLLRRDNPLNGRVDHNRDAGVPRR